MHAWTARETCNAGLRGVSDIDSSDSSLNIPCRVQVNCQRLTERWSGSEHLVAGAFEGVNEFEGGSLSLWEREAREARRVRVASRRKS